MLCIHQTLALAFTALLGTSAPAADCAPSAPTIEAPEAGVVAILQDPGIDESALGEIFNRPVPFPAWEAGPRPACEPRHECRSPKVVELRGAQRHDGAFGRLESELWH